VKIFYGAFLRTEKGFPRVTGCLSLSHVCFGRGDSGLLIVGSFVYNQTIFLYFDSVFFYIRLMKEKFLYEKTYGFGYFLAGLFVLERDFTTTLYHSNFYHAL